MAFERITKKMRLTTALEETSISCCNKPYFKMLLLGETGSGKTSLINLFYNCALVEDIGTDQLQLSEVRQYNDITLEDPAAKKMQSATTSAKQYETRLHKLDIGIIDTPGFGDTRGLERDNQNVEKIIQTLNNTNHINCVCLVVNGRNARLNPAIKYVLTKITTVLPQEIVNNLIVVFSKTNDKSVLNFDVKELNKYFQNTILTDRVFYIENPFCRLLKVTETKQSLSINATHSLARSFSLTATVLKQMYDVVKNFKPVHTYYFITLYEKHQEIEKNVITILAKFNQQRELDKRIKNQQEEVEVALQGEPLKINFKTIIKFKRYTVLKTQRITILYVECLTVTLIAIHLAILRKVLTKKDLEIVCLFNKMDIV